MEDLTRWRGRIDRRELWNVLPFAGPWGAEHQEVVRAGGGDHERAFGQLLTAHVGVIVVVARERVEQFLQAGRHRIDVEVPGKERGGLG